MSHPWSPMQLAIFEAIDHGATSLIAEAKAGSGKTTTMVEGLSHTFEDQRVQALAFNRDIAKVLKGKVPRGVKASTFHGLCFGVVREYQGDRPVVPNLAWDTAGYVLGNRTPYPWRQTAVKLASLAKATLTWDATDIEALADEFDLDFPKDAPRDRIASAAATMLEIASKTTSGPIDYDDMVWLPVVKHMGLPKLDWAFIDECQDLNPVQLEIVERLSDTAKVVAFGDRNQAIYGFRGAGSNTIPELEETLNAKVLPLSISYRCPKLVIAEAQRLVASIEAAPGAIEGWVTHQSARELIAGANPGDMVISRTNAPLISLALGWISKGRRAVIRGRDIGDGLARWVLRVKAPSMSFLLGAIQAWETEETARLIEADRSPQAIIEKAACLRALCEGASSPAEVVSKLDTLFSDGEENAIQLTTTHKAKGLEADVVWVLRDTYLKWPGAQEKNLLYVAITRSKRELHYVRETES